MDNPRIVITGIGVVAPNGIGKEEFWRNCANGVSGIKPITLFDTSQYRCRHAGEVGDFCPGKYLGRKGLRNLDRTTLLALVAAKLAISDAGLEVDDQNAEQMGVVLGSTMGSVRSISEFDKVGLREGPQYVNPGHFPNVVINSAASQVAIRFGLRGLNSTVSTGFSAGLDSIGYAMDMLKLSRAAVLLAGGVEELCLQTFLGFYKHGFLAMSRNGTPPTLASFGREFTGALLSEGAAVFVMETLESALSRGARAYVELLGYSTHFEPSSMYRYDPEARAAIAAIKQVLNEADADPADVDLISASANSTKLCDLMEKRALEHIFAERTRPVAVTTIKSLIGEPLSAGGSLQLAGAIGTFRDQQLEFGGGGISDSLSILEVGRQRNTRDLVKQPARLDTALINSVGPAGTCSSLIVSRLTDAEGAGGL